MKKVLFMFVAVLALVSCQKGAEKSSEATADSTKTEAVEEKAADATELVLTSTMRHPSRTRMYTRLDF